MQKIRVVVQRDTDEKSRIVYSTLVSNALTTVIRSTTTFLNLKLTDSSFFRILLPVLLSKLVASLLSYSYFHWLNVTERVEH